jgi:hypothetical protein
MQLSGSFNGFSSHSNLNESGERGELGWRSGQLGEERSFYQYIPVMQPNSWLPAFPLFPYSFPSFPSFLSESLDLPRAAKSPEDAAKTNSE